MYDLVFVVAKLIIIGNNLLLNLAEREGENHIMNNNTRFKHEKYSIKKK